MHDDGEKRVENDQCFGPIILESVAKCIKCALFCVMATPVCWPTVQK